MGNKVLFGIHTRKNNGYYYYMNGDGVEMHIHGRAKVKILQLSDRREGMMARDGVEDDRAREAVDADAAAEEELKRQGAVDATPAFDLATPRTVASLSNLTRQIGDEADRAYNIKIYHTTDERMSEEFLKVFNNNMKTHSVENWNATYSDSPSTKGGMLHDFLTWHNTERRKTQGNDERPVYSQDHVEGAWNTILEYKEEENVTYEGKGSSKKKITTKTKTIKYPHVWIAVLTEKKNKKPVGFCQINAELIKGKTFLMDLDKLWIAETSRGVSGLSLELCLLAIQKAFFDQEYEFQQIYACVINENLIALNFFLKSMNMMFGFTKAWIQKGNPAVSQLRQWLLQE